MIKIYIHPLIREGKVIEYTYIVTDPSNEKLIYNLHMLLWLTQCFQQSDKCVNFTWW